MDCPLPGTFEKFFLHKCFVLNYTDMFHPIQCFGLLESVNGNSPETDQEHHISPTDHVHMTPSTNVLLLSLKNITHAKFLKVDKAICIYVNVSQVTEKDLCCSCLLICCLVL